jgi:hypothetical protein
MSMSIEKSQAQIKSSLWKAIAQSGVSLSSISPEDQTKLVDHLTEGVLETVNELLDVAAAPMKEASKAVPLSEEEVVLWQGRPFLSLVELYTLTSERIKIVHGLIGKDIENFELIRVQDLAVKQSVGERMMGLGDITITGADPTTPMVVLRNIPQPNDVYETLRKAWLAARKKYGLVFREEM